MFTKEEYDYAMANIDLYFDKVLNEKEQKDFKFLVDKCVEYERYHFPIDKPSKLDAFLFREEQEDMNPETMFSKIVTVLRAYEEPHRKYHNINHIENMLSLAEKLGWPLTKAQYWAIFYHDAIYNVPAKNVSSEKLSAELYMKHWGNIHEFAKVTEQIILDTEKHIPTIEESKVVIDLDLSGLALSYWTNRDTIRLEFSCYNDEEFKIGRKKFLTGMLAKDKLFWYDIGGKTEEWTALARNNMSQELAQLGG